ncbi:MAG: AbrB/MazE/SpoVT family DNA-binding domain-containing protein [Desulfovermiculus sp.]
MSHTIKLTSKRQATFPVQLCREIGIQPGDELVLERKELEEGPVQKL